MSHPRLNLPMLRRKKFDINNPPGSLIDADSIEQAIRVIRDWSRYVDDQLDINPSIGQTIALEDDRAAYLPLTPRVSSATFIRGMVAISGNTALAGNLLASFRTGDTNAFIVDLGSGTATVTVGVGPLTGTTGVNGEFTVHVDDETNRIYIENRTGAVRAYTIQVFNLSTDAMSGKLVLV